MNNWKSTREPGGESSLHKVDVYSSWNYRKIRTNFIRYSAGILPYTYDSNGKCLFLLGKDHEGDWSDFGGRCEFKDRNDEKNTAAREFYEETLGSVININDCLEKLAHGSPVKIVSNTLNGSPYYMFLLYVEYSNYTDTFTKVSNFLRFHYSNERHNINKIIEKNCIRWVSIDTLLNCMENVENPPIILRGVFYKTIQGAKEQIIKLNNT